mmetsp:Transcript_116022/g.248033  ORF Transcript_116022/g.248033 Transcript_116022/m.248033 type:complete len:209 (+) Transcript_116022:1884-2510(+)
MESGGVAILTTTLRSKLNSLATRETSSKVMEGKTAATIEARALMPGAGDPSRKKLTYSSAKLSEGRCSRSMYSSSNSARMARCARRTSALWKPWRLTRSISRTIVRSAGRIRPGKGAIVMLIGFSGGIGSPVSVATMKTSRGPLGSIVSRRSLELKALWKRSSVSRFLKLRMLLPDCRGRLQSSIPWAKLNSGSVLLATTTPSESGTA